MNSLRREREQSYEGRMTFGRGLAIVILFTTGLGFGTGCSGSSQENQKGTDLTAASGGISTTLAAIDPERAPYPWLGESEKSLDPEKVRMGHELATTGYVTQKDGSHTPVISEHFVCTNCHLMQAEESPALYPNPERRLALAIQRDLPFLPGSPLHGVVNRPSWYNGDYQEKYGDLAKKAHTDLRNAIQLCAKECSKGRLLEPWELESMLHYLYSIQMQLNELDLSPEMRGRIQTASSTEVGKSERDQLVSTILGKIPAMKGTFDESAHKPATTGSKATAEELVTGKEIYERTCLYCHGEQRVSRFKLDLTADSFEKLNRSIDREGERALHSVVRHGVERPDRPRYMPLFPLERISAAQYKSLEAYIRSNNPG